MAWILAGWNPANGQINCPRLTELWNTRQPSHCTGQADYSIQDLLLAETDNCFCPGETLALTGVQRGGGMENLKLGIPTALAVSPDGKNTYVTAWVDNALTVFEAEATTGTLSFVEVHIDGEEGGFGLKGPSDVIVSPDGAHVYVAATLDSLVGVYERDPQTGSLVREQTLIDGATGGDAIGGANSVTITPSGGHIFVTGGDDSAIGVFERNSTTGHLTPTQELHNGVGDVHHMELPNHGVVRSRWKTPVYKRRRVKLDHSFRTTTPAPDSYRLSKYKGTEP